MPIVDSSCQLLVVSLVDMVIRAMHLEFGAPKANAVCRFDIVGTAMRGQDGTSLLSRR